jgi:hypothetical protein
MTPIKNEETIKIEAPEEISNILPLTANKYMYETYRATNPAAVQIDRKKKS